MIDNERKMWENLESMIIFGRNPFGYKIGSQGRTCASQSLLYLTK